MSGNTSIRQIKNQIMPIGNVARTLPYVAKTKTGGPDELDITFSMSNNNIDQIQSVFIDNTNGSELFVLSVISTGQQIKMRPGYQGWRPILVNPTSDSFVFTGGNALVPLFFVDVPMPIGDSLGTNLNVGVAALATAVVTGGVPVAVFATVPGVSDVPSDGAVIVNPFSASESLFVDLVNPAADTAPGPNGTTVELLPGGAFIVPPNFSGTVWADAITSGHTFSAYGADDT